MENAKKGEVEDADGEGTHSTTSSRNCNNMTSGYTADCSDMSDDTFSSASDNTNTMNVSQAVLTSSVVAAAATSKVDKTCEPMESKKLACGSSSMPEEREETSSAESDNKNEDQRHKGNRQLLVKKRYKRKEIKALSKSNTFDIGVLTTRISDLLKIAEMGNQSMTATALAQELLSRKASATNNTSDETKQSDEAKKRLESLHQKLKSSSSDLLRVMQNKKYDQNKPSFLSDLGINLSAVDVVKSSAIADSILREAYEKQLKLNSEKNGDSSNGQIQEDSCDSAFLETTFDNYINLLYACKPFFHACNGYGTSGMSSVYSASPSNHSVASSSSMGSRLEDSKSGVAHSQARTSHAASLQQQHYHMKDSAKPQHLQDRRNDESDASSMVVLARVKRKYMKQSSEKQTETMKSFPPKKAGKSDHENEGESKGSSSLSTSSTSVDERKPMAKSDHNHRQDATAQQEASSETQGNQKPQSSNSSDSLSASANSSSSEGQNGAVNLPQHQQQQQQQQQQPQPREAQIIQIREPNNDNNGDNNNQNRQGPRLVSDTTGSSNMGSSGSGTGSGTGSGNETSGGKSGTPPDGNSADSNNSGGDGNSDEGPIERNPDSVAVAAPHRSSDAVDPIEATMETRTADAVSIPNSQHLPSGTGDLAAPVAAASSAMPDSMCIDAAAAAATEERLAIKKRRRMDKRREYEEEVQRQLQDSSESSDGESIKPGKPVTLDEVLSFSSTARLVVQATPPFLIVHANAAYGALTGVHSHMAIGKPIASLLSISDQNRKVLETNANSMDTSVPSSNGNAAVNAASDVQHQNIPMLSRNHVAAAAAGHARATTFQDECIYDFSLERTIACCGQGRLHVVNALIKTGVEDCNGNTAHAIIDNRKIPFRQNGMSSTGSNNSSIPSNEQNHFTYACLMSVSPVVSDTFASSDTAVVTDNQDIRHNQSTSNNHHTSRMNNSGSITKRRKHNHYFSDHHHRMHKHHHRARMGKNVTHYVIQLEPIEDKKMLCSRDSFSSATTSTTVQAVKLGITKEELVRQRQIANQLQATVNEAMAEDINEQPPENASRTDESTLASSSSDQRVTTCG